MKKIVAALILVATGLMARELTLEQAVALAVDNSKDIKISELSKEIARLRVSTAFKTALPVAMYTGAFTTSEYNRQITEKRGVTVTDERNSWSQAIRITQPLYRGGAIKSGIQGAKAYEKIADLQYLQTKVNVRIATIENYAAIVRNERNLYGLESALKELKARYSVQSEQLNLNMLTKADLLKTENAILEIESQIIGAQNNISVQTEMLRMKTGLPKGTSIKVVQFKVPKYLSRGIDLESDLKVARTESIAALLAKYAVEYSDAERRYAMSEMLPKVNAFASYGAERTRFRHSYDDASWQAGVEVTWNVFDFGKAKDSYNIAKLELEQEKLSAKQTDDTIDTGVTSAYLELLRLEKLRDSKERAVAAARENYEIDLERYNAGVISTADYLQSEEAYRNAQVDHNQTIVDYMCAYERYRSLII
ncbi:MAG: TolC family protein [Fusobacteriaceae bacterium]|jgi:OMF family outer membrane factor|nr:TolC family protein [Fusobacteriaceae bacterium]